MRVNQTITLHKETPEDRALFEVIPNGFYEIHDEGDSVLLMPFEPNQIEKPIPRPIETKTFVPTGKDTIFSQIVYMIRTNDFMWYAKKGDQVDFVKTIMGAWRFNALDDAEAELGYLEEDYPKHGFCVCEMSIQFIQTRVIL